MFVFKGVSQSETAVESQSKTRVSDQDIFKFSIDDVALMTVWRSNKLNKTSIPLITKTQLPTHTPLKAQQKDSKMNTDIYDFMVIVLWTIVRNG